MTLTKIISRQVLKGLALGQFLKVHLQSVGMFLSSAFIDIVLVNTEANRTLIEFSAPVIVYCNMLISSKVD